MALKMTITYNRITLPNAHHRVESGYRSKTKKIQTIIVKTWKDFQDARGDYEPLTHFQMILTESDFITHFANGFTEQAGYEFIRTIDPFEEDNPYLGICPYNFKTNSIPSLDCAAENDQRLLHSWTNGDIIYNETLDKNQIYQDGSWVDE